MECSETPEIIEVNTTDNSYAQQKTILKIVEIGILES